VLFFWLQIAGDLVAANLSHQPLAYGSFGRYAVQAFIYSLAAMLALAFGMRCGTVFGVSAFGEADRGTSPGPAAFERPLDLQRVLVCYFVSLVVVELLNRLAQAFPSISQPVLAISLVRYVVLYLVAATVFQTRRGYLWLLLVALLEIGTGMLSFFASYKEPIFIILLALVSNRRAVTGRQIAIGAAAVMLVFWMSLVWSGIKGEYRAAVVWKPMGEKVSWMANSYFVRDIDYTQNAVILFKRIGYTSFYSMILATSDHGRLPEGMNFYFNAARHIVTPRFLFPHKGELNDSKITTRLLGIPINDKTSIGVGYVAQAHVDFGFPGLLAPLWLIGVLIGYAAQYFMTRAAPLVVRSAFATAAIFLAFPFAANIDKALGGFIIACIGMILVMRFGYPQLALWLAGLESPRTSLRPLEPARR
jgi:hypothetical protein